MAHSIFNRWTKRGPDAAIDVEILAAAALLSAALIIGLSTAADYGISIDEFNADDYGPKALAWYTSGFTDRSHFETVEFSLWYYGPWFHMLTAYAQSFDFADRMTVRHAMTFLVRPARCALPIGRIAVGRWASLTAVVLCLTTGYLYGSLFFTPIDVPFLAARHGRRWHCGHDKAGAAVLASDDRHRLLTGLALGTLFRRLHHSRLSARGNDLVRREFFARRVD
jgi:hypothetical protein